ncbi:Ig-like domain-containing protein, partial [bacterium]|nr:Ig-like domain-containing protein [bacterium]
MRKILCFSATFVVIAFVLSQSGCWKSDSNPTAPEIINEPISKPLVPSVRFNLVFPASTKDPVRNRFLGQIAYNEPNAAVLASENASPTVTFKLILVNVGNATSPTTTLSKTVSVDSSGSANVSFSSIPAQPVIGDIHIEGGHFGGFSDFHGTTDLAEGIENRLDVAPKGSIMPQDVAANVIERLVESPNFFSKVGSDAAAKIKTGIADIDFSSPAAYDEGMKRFMDMVSVTPSLILATSAIVMDSASLDGLSGMSAMGDGTNEMVFSNPTPQMKSIEPGHVLVSDYSSGFSTSEGILQKVISVASIGNELHFKTVQATLEDAIEDCSIEYFGRLNDQPPASIRARGKRSFIAEQKYGVEMVNLHETVGSNGISLNFDLNIKPTVYVKLEIKAREIKEFTIFFEVSENAKASISASKELSIGWKGQTVPVYLTTFYLPVGGFLGGIPITLWGKIVYSVEGLAKAGMKVGFEQSLQAGIGATRLDGVWSKKEKFETSFTPYIETSADVSCKLAAGPRIDANIFGLKGPYATLWGYGRLEAYPNQRLFAGLDADLGVQIDVTRSLKIEKTFNFNILEKKIWEKETLINLEPTVNIVFPSDNAEFSQGSNLLIKAVANDSGGGYVTKVSFYQGENLIGFDDSAPYEKEWPNLPAGTHSISAKAIDNSGTETISEKVRIIVKE